MLNIVYNIGYYCYIYRSAKLTVASKIDWEFEKSNKAMFMSGKTMVMQSFSPRFLPRKRLKIHNYCGSISFLSSPLWLKTSQIFRHMENIFAFGDVASGQRQRCLISKWLYLLEWGHVVAIYAACSHIAWRRLSGSPNKWGTNIIL